MSDIALESKKALIAAVVAILFNPVSAGVGYFVAKGLEAPKLKIEYINVLVQTEPLVLPAQIFSKLKDDPGLLNDLRSIRFQGHVQYNITNTYEDCENCFKEDRFSRRCVENLSAQLEDARDAYKSQGQYLQENITALEMREVGRDAEIRPMQIFGESIYALIKKDREGALRALKSTKKQLDVWIEILNSVLVEFNKFMSLESVPRTGQVVFLVGILNHGDSDGVIYPEASLSFGDSSISLRKGDKVVRPFNSDSPYLVIKSHSFEEVIFVVDEAGSVTGSLNKWRSLVQNRVQESFSLTAKTVNSRLVKTGRLPEADSPNINFNFRVLE